MLILNLTTDKFQLVTSAAATVDVHASWVDAVTSGLTSPATGRTNTAITTATTTDIVPAPASSATRNVKSLSIRNKDASVVTDVTLVFNQNGTSYEIHKETLAPGEALWFVENMPPFKVTPVINPGNVALTADFSALTTTTLTDITGMTLPVVSGKYYFFKFEIGYQAAATTTGIKLGVTIPAATIFAATVSALVSTAADGTANVFFGHLTSSGDSVIGTGTPAATTTHLAEIQGIIVPSANGNIQLQAATEVAASNVTVKQGTVGLIWRCG
jgi:hypothetical protein